MISASTIADLGAAMPHRDYPEPPVIEELRQSLEAQLAEATADWDRPAGVLGITKSRIAAVRRCPASVVAEIADRSLSEPLVVGALVDEAASLRMMSDRLPGKAPWLDAVMPAVEVSSPDIAEFVHRLSAEARDGLRSTVQWKCEILERRLGDLRNLPVTAQERFRVKLSGPGVQLSGRTDLVLGSSRRVVAEVKAGKYRPDFHTELSFYALLAALRDKVAPVAVATLTLDGETGISAFDVTVDMLEAASVLVVDTAHALVAIDQATAAQAWPSTRPSPLCQWCGVAERCPDAEPDAVASARDAAPDPDFVDEDVDEPW